MTHSRLSRVVTQASLPLQRALRRRRLGRLVIEHVQGIPLVVLPEVFNPAVFRSTDVLLRALRQWPAAPGAVHGRALDMGTGTGVLAIGAAQLGYQVVAVDINPDAVRCARMNSLLNRVEDVVHVREGDLFETVGGERFDLILFNPPFFTGEPRSRLDQAWRSVDVPERFGAALPTALTAGGRALIALSSHGGGQRMRDALRDARLGVSETLVEDLGDEIFTVVEARRPADAP